MKISKTPTKLLASPKAVITLFLSLPGEDRVRQAIARVNALSDDDVHACLDLTMRSFAKRHRNLEQTFRDHFHRIEAQTTPHSPAPSGAATPTHPNPAIPPLSNLPASPLSNSPDPPLSNLPASPLSNLPEHKKLLLGALFTKEYSIQSAALFNPSIVAHPDQRHLKAGQLRFVMSLRATGEGHISSIVFQTGIVDRGGNIHLDPPTGFFTRLDKDESAVFSKSFVRQRAEGDLALQLLPDSFTAKEGIDILMQHGEDASQKIAVDRIEEILDTNYDLENAAAIPLNEKVIFPTAKAESMGMEDVRFVQFEAGGQSCYYGTYTAYDGKRIRTQLIETKDFGSFRVRTLSGAAIADKGMALFPEKIDGKYVMISRQGGQNINIMFSDDLYRWDKYQLLMEPKYTWELLQLGNCGSPIKTEKGWLLLTHGVGMVRTYVISAILLDLKDPTRIIGRLDNPLIEAGEGEREGYVPNVVYTCGMLRHRDLLLIPYAVSDSATEFITLSLTELLEKF